MVCINNDFYIILLLKHKTELLLLDLDITRSSSNLVKEDHSSKLQELAIPEKNQIFTEEY